jgi:hypothetical protein
MTPSYRSRPNQQYSRYRDEFEPRYRRRPEGREDFEDDCGRDRWDRRHWHDRERGPGLIELAMAKRFEFGAIFSEWARMLYNPSYEGFRKLRHRVAETWPLTMGLKRSVWQATLPLGELRGWEGEWRGWCDRCGCPERECRCHPHETRGCEPHEEPRCGRCGCPERECRCHRHETRGCEPRVEPRCGRCGCPERECRCHHREAPRCPRCGCRESECGCRRRGTADIRIEARAGDVRTKVILVENNSPVDVTIDLQADPWMDSCGASVPLIPPVTFEPPQLKLAPREARESTATINVAAPPLTAGMSYFTRIQLKGSKAKPISVQLCLEALNHIDFYAQTDHCIPRREPPREEPRERHRDHRCFEPRDGGRWTREQRRFWNDLGSQERFKLILLSLLYPEIVDQFPPVAEIVRRLP